MKHFCGSLHEVQTHVFRFKSMSKSISTSEWDRLRSSFEGRTQEIQVAQQALFRVFQAISRRLWLDADKWAGTGMSLDVPFLLSEEQGVPGAAQWRPVGGEKLVSTTLLGWAAASGDEEAITWLLRKGAEPSQTFSGNYDAAWLAMQQSHNDIHRILLDRGANPSLRLNNATRTTRLIAATDMSNVEAVRQILKRKINVNAYDYRGRTALHYNFDKNPYTGDDMEIGQLLLDSKSNPNMEDIDGIPPHLLNESPEAMSLLQGYELRATMEAHLALEQSRQPVVEPEVPGPEFPAPQMPKLQPKQIPRRL